jgi:hypothetical protein
LKKCDFDEEKCTQYEMKNSRSMLSFVPMTGTGISQVHALVQNLQRIAKEAGHEKPLLVGIDQENGV